LSNCLLTVRWREPVKIGRTRNEDGSVPGDSIEAPEKIGRKTAEDVKKGGSANAGTLHPPE
jgi:hypothetical protein